MMRRLLILPLLLLAAWTAGSAHADGRWRDLPPEERRALREQMREQWHSGKRERGRAERGDGLPPEERQRLRDEMREQQRQSPEHGGRRRQQQQQKQQQ